MPTQGGASWAAAGDLPLSGTTGTTPVTAAAGSESPYHAAWWVFTAPSDGMLLIDNMLSPFTSEPDLYLAVYTGADEASKVLVSANDDTPDPVTGASVMSRVGVFVEAGTTYHVACGLVGSTLDPGTPDAYVLRTVWWPAGPGVPGPTAEAAGELPIGYNSRLSLSTMVDDNTMWWTFTPDADQIVNLDLRVLDESDGVTFTSDDSSLTIAPADGVSDPIPAAGPNAVYKVSAGVQYLLSASAGDVRAFVAVGATTHSDWVQDDDFEIDTPFSSIGDTTGAVNGDEWQANHSQAHNPDNPDNATLQMYANTELSAVPGPSVIGGASGPGTSSNAEVGASRFSISGGATQSSASAVKNGLNSGFEVMHPAFTERTWSKDFTDPPTGAIASYQDTLDAAWQKVEVSLQGHYIEANEWSTGHVSSIPGSIRMNLSPSTALGTGRTVDTYFTGDWGGGIGGETTWDAGRFLIATSDYVTDGAVYLVAQPIVPDGTWGLGNDDTPVTASSEVIDAAPQASWGGSRIDTFTPPTYQWVYPVPTVDLPDLVITIAPPCRIHPREDHLGAGSGRIWPPPRSHQASPRRAGGYY